MPFRAAAAGVADVGHRQGAAVQDIIAFGIFMRGQGVVFPAAGVGASALIRVAMIEIAG